MRTPQPNPVRPEASTVPLLDASFLPAEEDWAVLEALNLNAGTFDDDDRFADFGVPAGDFD
jgi:hypothetical protein